MIEFILKDKKITMDTPFGMS